MAATSSIHYHPRREKTGICGLCPASRQPKPGFHPEILGRKYLQGKDFQDPTAYWGHRKFQAALRNKLRLIQTIRCTTGGTYFRRLLGRNFKDLEGSLLVRQSPGEWRSLAGWSARSRASVRTANNTCVANTVCVNPIVVALAEALARFAQARLLPDSKNPCYATKHYSSFLNTFYEEH